MKNVTKKLAVILATTLFSFNAFSSEVSTTSDYQKNIEEQEQQAAQFFDFYTSSYCRIVDKCESAISIEQEKN
ncbi:hypothetical protein [Pseudoalteromonas piscicida]|uniref:Secreted protein n=1 Tax=Pseudoalteromonas piscicida TaxID=43662 RepID=A0AAD0RSH4_PSEO7|nr:hypothetical protein [Pseudoalteromonas piscicida]ASD68774.1 hypothetical protein B1L02_18260 [Pseudoalteromonas piscicida]AXQ99518.1 hypothetical protein D0N37_18550 [Pseudoalteromonas piscicida]AXR03833.1 hypothetical protein D0511_18340 [Pseudoalteromonas piscicida]